MIHSAVKGTMFAYDPSSCTWHHRAEHFLQGCSKYTSPLLKLLRDAVDICLTFSVSLEIFHFVPSAFSGRQHAFHHLHFVYATFHYVLRMLSAACGSLHEGLWELSDNMLSYHEKFPSCCCCHGNRCTWHARQVCIRRSPWYTKIVNAIRD